MKKRVISLKRLALKKDVISSLMLKTILGGATGKVTAEDCTISRCNDQCTSGTWTVDPPCTTATQIKCPAETIAPCNNPTVGCPLTSVCP